MSLAQTQTTAAAYMGTSASATYEYEKVIWRAKTVWRVNAAMHNKQSKFWSKLTSIIFWMSIIPIHTKRTLGVHRNKSTLKKLWKSAQSINLLPHSKIELFLLIYSAKTVQKVRDYWY